MFAVLLYKALQIGNRDVCLPLLKHPMLEARDSEATAQQQGRHIAEA